MNQGLFKEVSRVIQASFKGVLKGCHGRFKDVFGNFHGCFQSVSKVFQGSFKKMFKVLCCMALIAATQEEGGLVIDCNEEDIFAENCPIPFSEDIRGLLFCKNIIQFCL